MKLALVNLRTSLVSSRETVGSWSSGQARNLLILAKLTRSLTPFIRNIGNRKRGRRSRLKMAMQANT